MDIMLLVTNGWCADLLFWGFTALREPLTCLIRFISRMNLWNSTALSFVYILIG
jgi:hypothetical protein